MRTHGFIVGRAVSAGFFTFLFRSKKCESRVARLSTAQLVNAFALKSKVKGKGHWVPTFVGMTIRGNVK
ncbi:MAG: hypothetical protein ABIP44_00415, partial [Pseudoxanthomonas sp.]